MFSIKVLFIVGGVICCALLFVGMSNDTERHDSVRKWRKRMRVEQAARAKENKAEETYRQPK